MGLVHLDIKPDNVFLSFSEPHCPVTVTEDAMDGLQQSDGSQPHCTYKIGIHAYIYTCTMHVYVCGCMGDVVPALKL